MDLVEEVDGERSLLALLGLHEWVIAAVAVAGRSVVVRGGGKGGGELRRRDIIVRRDVRNRRLGRCMCIV